MNKRLIAEFELATRLVVEQSKHVHPSFMSVRDFTLRNDLMKNSAWIFSLDEVTQESTALHAYGGKIDVIKVKPRERTISVFTIKDPKPR